MPIITDISAQKRAQARFSVYVDEAYAFSLTDLELSGSRLRVGAELTATEVLEWRLLSEAGKAYNSALQYLGYRPRSRRELDEYLRRKDYSSEIAQSVIARLEAMGLIDDRAFAQSWIESRQLLRPRSARQLEQELIAKGIDRDVIDHILGDMNPDDQLNSLVTIIEKKRLVARYQDAEKLKAYLARQGYRYEDIIKARKRLDDV